MNKILSFLSDKLSLNMGNRNKSFKNLLTKTPQELAIVIDLLLVTVGFICALYVRFYYDAPQKIISYEYYVPFFVLLNLRIFSYILFGIYDLYSRYVSTFDVIKLFKAHLTSTLLFTLFLWTFRFTSFSRSIVIIECLVSFYLIVGIRFLARLIVEKISVAKLKGSKNSQNVLIIGAGVSGQLLIKTMLASNDIPYNPVALLDDNQRIIGTYVHGIKVYGDLDYLKTLLNEKKDIAAIIVSMANISTIKIEEIRATALDFHIPVKHLQSFEEIACQDLSDEENFPDSVKKLTIEEVLNKEIQISDNLHVRNEIENKSVLITGAGGSIGSELVRQVLHLNPKTLILVDKSEYNLYAIQEEIKNTKLNVKKIYFLGSIFNKNRMIQAFEESKPDVVFHAAAFKHVPLLEENCYEAFTNNVIGTRNLIDLSQQYDVKKFILISTDKAVDPSSVMGCTKRLAELMVREAGISNKPNHLNNKQNLYTAVVRFGNVINSSGSVIPLFKKQIFEGKSLTVTHPDMERFFMSIREAVKLVLTAGTLGDKGEIYLLDMGKPIKIVDVAKKLLTLYGRRDIDIVFTGLRQGEKLSESLFSDSEIREKAKFDKIFVVKPKVDLDRNVIFNRIEELNKEITYLSNFEIARRLHNIVSGNFEPHLNLSNLSQFESTINQ